MTDEHDEEPSDPSNEEAGAEPTPTFDLRDLLSSIPLVPSMKEARESSDTAPVREPASLDSLDEIAEDMLDLLQRFQAIDARVQHVSQQVGQVAQHVQTAAFTHGKELAALRSELLDERKGFVALFAFTAIVPVLDQLQQMENGLDPAADKRMLTQLTSVIGVLKLLVRNLGFEAYEAFPGDRFDPVQMECMAYESGDPGVVVSAVRTGYRCKHTVVRPAGVTLPAPKPTPSEKPQDEGGD